MKKVFAILAVLIILFAGTIYFIYFRGGKRGPRGPKPVPMAVSKHSPGFNQSVKTLLKSYYDMSEAFVNWDSAGVNRFAEQLKLGLDSLRLDELKVDTTGIYESALDPLNNARAETVGILSNSSLDMKRTALNNLSENIRLLLIVVKYDQEKLYWQECPMAFGADRPGNWLSQTAVIRNPYLGTRHPAYKDDMLVCGETKDTLNFMQTDTLKE